MPKLAILVSRIILLYAMLIAIVLLWGPMVSANDKDAHPNATPHTNPPASLAVTLERSTFNYGDEIHAPVALVNSSDSTLHLEYINPVIMAPQVMRQGESKWTTIGMYYDQVSAKKETTLAPQQELALFAPAILLKDSPLPAVSAGKVKGYWKPAPGKYKLRYSVNLKTFLPGIDQEIHSKELPIEINEPDASGKTH